MKITHIAAILACTAMPVLVAAPVSAQSSRDTSIPAEFPPASFSGLQYVDSRGCVYVRAGVDGATTWVPRMNRQRQIICDQAPSVAANAAPALQPPATQAEILVPRPEPVPQVRVPAPVAASAPEPILRPAAAQPPMRTVASVPASNAPAMRAAPPPPAASTRIVAPAPAPVRRVVQQPAPMVMAQATPPSRATGIGRVARPGEVPGNARMLPRHLWEQRDQTHIATVPPAGFQNAWDDDRLNPRRAEQSPNGHAQTARVWTNTVPRRLITPDGAGRAYAPRIIIPHGVNPTAGARVSTKGQATQVQRRATVSTRSAPSKPAATARFVQVGVYGQEANARSAATRLQRLGLPVTYGVTRKGSQTLRAVLIPVSSQSDVSRALQTARSAGFSDAFLR